MRRSEDDKRSVRTQSLTKYTWLTISPRFYPLPKREYEARED